MTTLPDPRAFLTSLINTLTAPFPPPTQLTTDIPYDAPENTLKSLCASHRALLSTLHVLFPPPMLLQALDLLDRGLVTRLISLPPPDELENQHLDIKDRSFQNNDIAKRKGKEVWPPQANIHLSPLCSSPQPRTTDKKKSERNQRYLVRSSQPTRGRYASSTGGTLYTVHLEAWNCSCAAFAFAAFPAPGSAHPAWNLDGDEDDEMANGGQEEEKWEFGGLSLDGKEIGGGIPVCKHLVACLLGERWSDMLGGYVKEKDISREEMAGYGAE